MRDDEPRDFEFGPSHPVSAQAVRSGRRMLWVLLLLAVLMLGVGGYLYGFERERLRGWLEGTPLELPATLTTVYKWKDREGNWQLTDMPPPEGIEYELLDYRSDTNILPLVPRED